MFFGRFYKGVTTPKSQDSAFLSLALLQKVWYYRITLWPVQGCIRRGGLEGWRFGWDPPPPRVSEYFQYFHDEL